MCMYVIPVMDVFKYFKCFDFFCCVFGHSTVLVFKALHAHSDSVLEKIAA